MLVPKLRFSEFTDEWKCCKIKDIATVIGGGTPATFNEEYWNGDIQWFTPTEINKKYISKSKRTISKAGLKRSSARLLPKGTVLLTTRATLGLASILLNEGATNQGFQSLIAKNNINNEFLYYLTDKFLIELNKKAFGSTFLEISKTNVEHLNIKIPNLKEQEKISKFLSLLDKKIELQSKKIEALKMYSESTKNIVFKSFKKNNSTIYSLKDLLKEVNNKAKINNQYSIISSTTKGIFLQSDYFNKQAASSNTIGYKIIEKNQLVLSPQNLWMGNININDKYDIGIVSPSYKIFDVNHNIDLNILDAWIKSRKALYDYNLSSEQGASVVRKNLNLDLFYEISLYLPKIQEQKKYGNLLINLKNKIKLEEKKLNEMIQLKKGLMQNMFV